MRSLRIRLATPLTALPLLSLGLAAVWALSLLVVQLGFAARLQRAEQQVVAAAHFAIEHPEVEIPERLLVVARSVLPGFESNEMFAFLRGRGSDPATQAQLDEMAAVAFDALDAHPHRVLGLVPARPRPHAALTHVAVHAGWVHGLASLIALLLLAPTLERLWGRPVLGLAWVSMALGGAAVSGLVHRGSEQVLVGGGGLLAGCAAALVVRFRDERIDWLAWAAPVVGAELRAPAWAGLGLWAGAAALGLGLPGGGPPGVQATAALPAQLAGALVGAGAALWVRRLGWEDPAGVEPAPAEAAAEEQPFSFRRVQEARARGDADAAFEWLAAEVERSGRNRDAVVTFFCMCVERGEPERALPALGRLVCEELRRGADEVALAQWHEFHSQAPGQRLPAEALLQLVPTAQRLEGDEVALVLLQQLLDPADGSLTAAVATRAARLALDLDPPTALVAARRALAVGGLAPGERLELEALVTGLSEPDEKPDEPPPPGAGPAEEGLDDRSALGRAGEWSALADFPDGAITEAQPLRLASAGVVLQARGHGELPLAFGRIRAVALVGVRGLGPRPVLLVDLLVDGGGSERPLAVMRLRSDAFDPRRLVRGKTPLEALVAWVAELVERSGARPLPDVDAAAGRPVRVFDDLDEYHARILRPMAEEWA